MDIREAIKHVKPCSYLAKIDLSAAYRSVNIHPSDYLYTGIKWIFEGDSEPTYMYDAKLPFGASKSPQIFQRLSSAVCRIFFHMYNYVAIAYLDDYLIFGETYEVCNDAQIKLIALLRRLGFSINWNKVVGPSTCLTFLGVQIDTISMSLSLPSDKLCEFSDLLCSFMGKKRASRKQLETLIGKLSWASQVIQGGHTFLRRMINLKCAMSCNNHKVLLTAEFYQDILWWKNFISVFNGSCKIQDQRPLTSLQTDACTEGGGAYFMGDYCYINWVIDMPQFALEHINIKELLIIFLAICRWGSVFQNRHVLEHCDNKSAVSWINKGSTHTGMAMVIIRVLFWVCALLNCTLRAIYLPGDRNRTADTCSRLHEHGKLSMLYSIAPSLQFTDFNMTELSNHMSSNFIRFRWNQCIRAAEGSWCAEREGVG